jgi:hypothetical protein
MPIIIDAPTGDPDSTLWLCQIWFNAASNLADAASFTYASEAIGITSTPRAEVRQLVNRRRVVRRGTRVYDTINLTLQGVTPAQLQWLRDHVGTIVCVRDHVGSKVYGVYRELPRDVETRVRTRAEVKLTFDEITHTEVV